MADQPLTGIRVVDMSRVLAGPWAGQMLADLGAEVIKIEKPVTGDESRVYGAAFLQGTDGSTVNQTPTFLAANRGKKSITANLASEGGQQLIRDLVAKADVVIENYKVGDLARRGLDYEQLKKVNPRLIYCSVTGFGQTGPYRFRPGYDPIAQAMSGFMSTTGIPDGEPGAGPMKAGPSIIDLATGLYADIAILAALYRRDAAGGTGEYIDMSLLDCGLAFTSHFAMHYAITGEQPARVGTQGVSGMPGGVFPCKDGHIMIAAGTDALFPRFCRVIGREDMLADPRFASNGLRVTNRRDMVPILNEAMSTWTVRDLYLALVEAKVPCSPVNGIGDAFEDPQIQARGMVRTVEHPRAGSVRLLANPIRFTKMATADPVAPPEVGQHEDEILGGLLGYDRDKIDTLRKAGAI
ncbi:CaiB/BaiF CoA-transferase family protein [Sphingosinicella ginsenosidimutans]|uniref:CoA transferase n=1 Tax=Allosphingosinicella ginsenosidimutans TaxID=1176539 RepID=A0A5C6TRK7_9SPHN|nr:CoA transferase [Sphingosinicella ginsenosidimutans]TXC62585.1 CoA transferase [Sphingosinicella ginsenosidimutans]